MAKGKNRNTLTRRSSRKVERKKKSLRTDSLVKEDLSKVLKKRVLITESSHTKY